MIQLTVFADRIQKVRPTIMFWDEGKHIKASEKISWDKTVQVFFSKRRPGVTNSEEIDIQWMGQHHQSTNKWIHRKSLVADVHRAQQTDPIKRLLQNKKTVLVNEPPGCIRQVQYLDVVINKPCKNTIKEQFERPLDENLDNYVDGNLTVSDRIVWTTKWVGNAWDRICQSKDMIMCSFKKWNVVVQQMLIVWKIS